MAQHELPKSFKHGTKVGEKKKLKIIKKKYHSKASSEATYPLKVKKQSSTNIRKKKRKGKKKLQTKRKQKNKTNKTKVWLVTSNDEVGVKSNSRLVCLFEVRCV